MPKASPIQTSFNAGELSPLLGGRVDLAKYFAGCATLENFIPLIEGPAQFRPGTRHVGEVKDSAKVTRLIKFLFNTEQAYICEFGDLVIRFYTDYGLLLSAGNPVEVVTPYLAADLFELVVTQSNDVLYIAHGDYAPRKLERLSASSFQLTAIDFKGGPFKDENATATTVYASAATGAGITLTASAAIFTASHVGALFRLAEHDLSVHTPWEAGKSISTNNLRRNDGKVYRANNTNTTGTVPPVHERGFAFDGQGAVEWEYQHPGHGYAKIVGFTSSTVVTADVVERIPNGAVGIGDPTPYWAFGAWSTAEGYPTCVRFFGERLGFAKVLTVDLSNVADFENFADRDRSGDVLADSAIRVTIASGQVDPIRWLDADARGLLAGTSGGEFVISAITTTEPFGPTNIQVQPQSTYGSAAVQPARVGAAALFVTRSRQRLREMVFRFEADRYVAPDMTALARHIGKGGIVELAYQQEPDAIVWAARADGVLLGFSYDREQDAAGWHRHPLGGAGIVESVATIPSPDATRDDLWLLVKRTINGTTRRYVEYMVPQWEEGGGLADAFFVDSGLTYSGAPADLISGLGHLEGMTLAALGDGATHPNVTVLAGQVQMMREASKWQLGLPYTGTIRTMRLEAGAADGTAQGKIKRISRMVIRFWQSLAGTAGPDTAHLDDIPDTNFRDPATPMGAGPALFDGDARMEWPGGYETEGHVVVRQTLPLPMTVQAVMPRVTTQDGG